MMSISNVSAGAAASGYYKEEGYYKAGTEEGERAATWFGKAADENGLSGFVDDRHFAQLLDGEAPDGKLMGRYVDGERQHRPGLDLTFSASKSASVAALVIGDKRIIEAHDAAVRAVMTVVEERFIKTRFQQDGEIVTKNGEGIIAGIYRHDTSRALDPNLHSHAVIANMVKNENGGYSAIRNEAVYKNQKLITEIYRSDFENRMADLGIATERGKYGEVNISGISQEVTEAFSKRRQEILNALDNKGMDVSPETASKAALATRAAKHKNLDRDALRETWRADALAAGLGRDQLDLGRVGHAAPQPVIPLDQQRPIDPLAETGQPSGMFGKAKAMLSSAAAVARVETDPRQAVNRAVEHISERESAYSRADITVAAMHFAYRSDFKAVDAEINRQIKAGRLFESGEDGQILTDKASVELERSILASWRKSEKSEGLELQGTSRRTGESTLTKKLSETNSLTAGQRASIETSLTGSGRYVGIQGYAGSGKTFMMERMAHYAGQSGYEVKGFAPSHQAVQELASVLGGAETLAKVTTAERHHPQDVDNSRTILVVDEASMVSAQDMRSFMDYAERTGAPRVVFVGDTQQLDAVAAGQPFAQMQKAGMRTAVMDEIRRQRDNDLKAAVYHSIRGEITAAFNRMENNVLKVDDPRQEAAERFLALNTAERQGTRILALTNAARAEINEAVRDGLRQEGRIASDEVKVNGLLNRQLTEAMLADARSYAPGDVVMSVATSKEYGLKKNGLYVVRETDHRGNKLTVEHEETGVRTTLPLAAKFNQRELGKALVAYEREARGMAEGDQVRFRITDPESGIKNGLRAEIKSTKAGVIEAETQEGSRISIPADSLAARGLDHDYAATAHAVQGESVDRVIVAMRSTERLATQKSFYVEISRARDEAMLLTEDPDRLSKTIENETGIRQTALDAWLDGRLAGAHARQPEEEQTREEPQEKPEAVKEKEAKEKEPDTPALPGLFEEKLKEVEKQAEIVLQRDKDIER
ncbi:MobF family relaxase [Leisingera caerulea]|uniref:Relaxase domain-containing protein n=1 Tax=Leisingera caerulea TaxID=506591 RepID=A0A9Q9M091_LEICA|nr:MobF family relaxase [Leisingera caerulea]UWQ56031.1 relaxase domain-containing protein [Leisingera caerulea]